VIRPVRALAAVLVAGCAARAAPSPLAPAVRRLAAEFDSAFAAPEYARASWGIVVQSLATGEVLYRRNAERLFMPASNQKILTGAVALARLGPEFRWHTSVLSRGPVRGDTLAGDLVVIGRGDPTFSQRVAGGTDILAALRPWADSLRARGIHVIAGRVAGDASYFPDPPLGGGWSWDDLEYAYSAPVGALQFNEGFAVLEVTPGEAGGPAGVALNPGLAPLRLFNQVRSVPAESASTARLTWTRALASDSVMLGGTIAAGRAPVRLSVAVPDPARYFEAALTQVLREAGVTVLGTPPASSAHPPTPLFEWSSPPLRDVLPHFEKPSQNQIGEALLRTLGSLRGVASQDSGRAVMRETLAGWGVPEDAVVIVDGSGLSRYNYVAPEALARALVAMARHPDGGWFVDALPVAGVDGTLSSRMRGTAAEGNARAKTGSIANTRNISGYVTTRDGERLVFVLLANHFTSPASVPTALQDRLVERLANFSRH
jgi:D-alanyl-D-alanine carboxypeptidase/D-alanyl-D-alanine-endopeptidase (penicillin-binding protein 4)